ncbi:MAG: transporter substrate-binding domain-containing protein [Chitinivibrionales bacterium]|nr:transporter substrate-binding domain-containing protein [Chitinivibrionales bacterium]
MFKSKGVGIVICFFMTGLLYSQELKEINVVSDSWPGVTNEDGTGLYFELVKTVFGAVGITMKHQIAPYPRAVAMVLSNSGDVWIGSGLNEEPSALYPKWHHSIIKNGVIFNKNTIKEWHGPDDFKGKKVCWVRGYDIDKYWGIDKTKFTLNEVTNSVQGLKMLEAGRVDYYVDVEKQIQKDLKTTKLNPNNYQIKPAFDQKLFLGFANNERGKKLRDIWDQQIEATRNSEAIKNVFKKYEEDLDFAY